MTRATDTFSPRPGVEARHIDQGAVLMDMNSGAVFELNRLGAEIWSLIAEHRSVATICEQLTAKYQVEQLTVNRDVDQLLTALTTAGLITPE